MMTNRKVTMATLVVAMAVSAAAVTTVTASATTGQSKTGTTATARATTFATVRQATSDGCLNGEVGIYAGIPTVLMCMNFTGSQNFDVCNVYQVDTNNHWVAFTWGDTLSLLQYQPGMPPGSTWGGGVPACIGRLDIDA